MSNVACNNNVKVKGIGERGVICERGDAHKVLVVKQQRGSITNNLMGTAP